MKIALVQSNPTVGALAANADKLIDAAHKAHRLGAQLVVSPELALVGYPPRDLLDRPDFVRQIQEQKDRVVAQTPKLTLVFGSVGTDGTRLTNQAVVAYAGEELGQATKQLLPSYDVFDEKRYFSRGDSLCRMPIEGVETAITICEDAWAKAPELEHRYAIDPLAAESMKGVGLLLNLSASPFTLTKLHEREQIFSAVAKRCAVPTVMVNQIGGNDELIFDGGSAVWDAQGQVLARASMFKEQLLIADIATRRGGISAGGRVETAPSCEEQAAYEALVIGVRDYVRKCGFQKVVLGLSGGIDSALVATVATDALGPKQVLGVAMPSRYSSEGSIADAKALADNLGINFDVIEIEPMFSAYLNSLGATLDSLGAASAHDVTWENVQARIRGATVMAISNRTGALPLTTGNKSELAVGYCTLYGDMVGGLSVISDVPKTMVYRIARWLNRDQERIPDSTITKPPSAELRPDQKDEDSLPPYEVLDPILNQYIEEHLSEEEIIARGAAPETVKRVIGLVVRAEYKRRQAAPGLIITRKAFGSGRRVPIAQVYR